MRMRYFDRLEGVATFGVGYALTVGLTWLFFRRTETVHHLFGAVMGVAYLVGLRRYRGLPVSPLRIWKNKRNLSRSRATIAEAKRRRIAELASDPVRQKYIPLIKRGEVWSDDQIEYNENPQTTATCVHLEPIERAMRLAGTRLRRLTGPNVRAQCRIDEAGIKRRFAPPASVQYREWYQPAHERDNPQAEISCVECRSAIDVIHPGQAREHTPWFPTPD
jgi:hypothetical protein